MQIEYTTKEGGPWYFTEVNATVARVRYCLRQNAWVTSESIVEYGSELGGTEVHSVRFPDGRVWDANFGTLRYLFCGAWERVRGRSGYQYKVMCN